MLNELFKKLSIGLNKDNIPYMIIGGQAALQYMDPRFTNDIDVTLGVGIEDANKLLTLCDEINLKILTEDPLDFISQTMVLPVVDTISNFRIDFIFSFTQFEKDAISRANFVDIEGCSISFCSLEDLIILKLFAGRARDNNDVKTILRKNPDYNKQFVIDNLIELGKAVDIDLISRLIDLEKK